MKQLWILFIFLFSIWIGFQIMSSNETQNQNLSQQQALIVLKVDEEAIDDQVKPLGLNLGGWNTWGAEVYSNNLLFNPGFEGKIDRMLVIVSKTDPKGFYDEKGWGQPDGYWKEATFEVRTGKSEGKRGIIKNSLQSSLDDLPQYIVDGDVPNLEPKDVIVLSKALDPNPISQWWVPDSPQERVIADPSQHRPGSHGVQSVLLVPEKGKKTELICFIDHITKRAGKLVLINGVWRLKFWAKAEGPLPRLQIEFKRLNNSPPFLSESIMIGPEWQEYILDFTAHDNGEPEILMLKFTPKQAPGGKQIRIWLDDAWLGPADAADSSLAFRKEVVDLLKKLRPAFLRDWQGQLADTFVNRTADQYARKCYVGRSAGQNPIELYNYSIHDFLDLCQTVKALPWIVIPTVLNDREYEEFGQYLAQHAHNLRFKEVYIEFGNENWNWVFRPAGIPYPEVHGLLAEKAFKRIMLGAGLSVNLRKVVNGQHVNPALSLAYIHATPSADILATAPYFFYSLSKAEKEKNALQDIFENDHGLMKQTLEELKLLKKQLAISEVNLHTTQGNAPAPERDRYVASLISGTALAKRLLESLFLGIRPIMVFSLSQFDTKANDIDDYVRLWGIVRDVSPTKRLRPTGLIFMMLNQTIGEKVFRMIPQLDVVKSKNDLTAVAFKTHDGWSAAIASTSLFTKEIEIQFPDDKTPLPTFLTVIDAKSPFETNENQQNVTIISQPLQTSGRNMRFTVPPCGFVTLNLKKVEF